MDVARTEGEIRATTAGKAELERKGDKEPEKGASKEAWASYNKALAATDSYKAVGNGQRHPAGTPGGHGGDNSTVTPIPEQNKDDLAYLALKGKEAQEAAGKLGFDRRIPAQKAPFNSHGQPVYFNGKTYITPDIDSHNVTNGWKMFDRKGERMGTYDNDLNRIKD